MRSIKKLSVIRIRQPEVLRIPQCELVMKEARRLLRQVGIDLASQGITEMEEPKNLNYKEPFQYTGAVRQKFIETSEDWKDPEMLIHIFCRPIVIGRYSFFGGVGGCVCCSKPPFVSVSSAGVATSLLRPKGSTLIRSCAVMMAHEIGHIMGAKHIDGKSNIMNSSVNLYNKHDLVTWAAQTRKDIKDCGS